MSPPLEKLLPLTPASYHILVALSDGPVHGYGIAEDVEAMTEGRITLGPGTLYGALQRMRDDGLIEDAPDPGREGAHADRRRYYRLTDLGWNALRSETSRLSRVVGLAHARLRQ